MLLSGSATSGCSGRCLCPGAGTRPEFQHRKLCTGVNNGLQHGARFIIVGGSGVGRGRNQMVVGRGTGLQRLDVVPGVKPVDPRDCTHEVGCMSGLDSA